MVTDPTSEDLMTTVSTAPPEAATNTRIRDTRTFRRVGAALLLPLGPLTVAFIRLILPYYTPDGPSKVVAGIAAAPGRETAVVWLSLLLVFTLVPSVIVAGRVTIRRAPVLTTIAWILLVPGFIALQFAAGDPTYRALVGLDPTTGATVIDRLNHMSALSIADNFFALAHIVGLILLGVAALRTKAVPTVIGWLLIVSQPLHLIFAIIVPSHPLDFGSWILTTIGFAFLARTALRMDNDAWDLPPVP
jgi:hypothetical protein